ncbi:GTP-binding protein [Thermosulfidibacter takaii ABI70S6]|uniref:GTPase Der n=1 Tax=Thermosulfidibacter takaii (strain DSM 17441 / JCM 13301 / NBRC 103674 / ABI70S6) TaxID=1298851 RepID=A0A0S3QUN4_THET7|nr:ribosome biogenesis GTPase Der [Thermosulfidibacter takaii]BAT72027.1 GTP-binding protein [Thermosulfidibacter takaii ABI70S6]
MSARIPKIAIVGRPNVGKSSLFNRLIRKRKAIVAPEPGVTVDRIEEEIELFGKKVKLIDTGGITEKEGVIEKEIREQVKRAIEEADLLWFLVDAKEGLHPLDQIVAEKLRQTEKKVFLVVNKADNETLKQSAYEFLSLGIEPMFTISVTQKKGITELIEKSLKVLPEESYKEETKIPEETDGICKIAVIGRPNVGKSSIINYLVGDQRTVVSEIPGTTKDAVDVKLETSHGIVLLIDTAGLRRKSRVSSKLEAYSITRTVESIRRCDVAVLVVDSTEGITDQDKKIAGLIMKEKKGVIVALNKWDLIKEGGHQLLKDAREELYFLPNCPFLLTSAVTGKGLNRIIPEALEINRLLNTRVNTAKVNKAIESIVEHHHPPASKGKYIKIYYGTQVETKPPTFVVFSNYPEEIPDHYKRYFEKSLREKLGFDKVPIEVIWRKRT